MQRKIIAFLHIGCTMYSIPRNFPPSHLWIASCPLPHSGFSLFSFSTSSDSCYFPSPLLCISASFLCFLLPHFGFPLFPLYPAQDSRYFLLPNSDF